MVLFFMFFFFFKQTTAYEMRISDWSSDVCSSDLFEVVDRIDDDHPPLAERQGQMQAADHLPNLFDRDVAREFLGLVFRLAGEAQDLGMVARVDQSRRRIVAAIVERGRLSFAAAPRREEKRSEEKQAELHSQSRHT